MILTPEQRAKLRRRDVWLRAANIRIEDKHSKQLVEFRPNRVQQALYDRMDAAEAESRPFFALGLKSRQHGFSTAVQVELNHRAQTRSRYHTLTIAHKRDSSATIFGMTETMRANMHRDFLVPQKRGNVGRHLELVSPIDSKMDVETAGDREAGRSTSRRAVHASEAAFWPDLATTLRSLRQMVHAAPGAMFIIESTANGLANAFADEWVAAKDNPHSDYETLFFPWWWDLTLVGSRIGHPPPPGGFDDLDDEEQKLLKLGLTHDQLAWRRWAIVNLCGGSLDSFHQEYPATDVEAFLSSGRLALSKLETIVTRDPLRVGNIVGEPYRGGGKIRFVDHPKGYLKLFVLPAKGREYIVFVDPMGEPKDAMYEERPEQNKQDYAAIQVVDAETGEQAAVWHGRIDEAGLAKEAARLGYLFNSALIAVERVGGYGKLTVHLLSVEMAYPRLYRREVYAKASRKPSLEYGWMTSETTRPVMVAALQDLILHHPELIHDEGTLGEMHRFVVLNGKPQAAVGYHDDRVMGLAGALAVQMRGDSLVRLGPPRKKARPVGIASRAPRPKVAA